MPEFQLIKKEITCIEIFQSLNVLVVALAGNLDLEDLLLRRLPPLLLFLGSLRSELFDHVLIILWLKALDMNINPKHYYELFLGSSAHYCGSATYPSAHASLEGLH